MIFRETPIPGPLVVEPEPIVDERGFFGRTFDAAEFRRRGLCTHFPQWSVSFNERAGTLRGMHYQDAPRREIKLVRCTSGAIFDVVVDLRTDSPTFCQSATTELSAENRRMMYVPEGFAHGFQTLTDGAEVAYFISVEYDVQLQRGVRWNDPAFAIEWPAAERIMSERDRAYPDFLR